MYAHLLQLKCARTWVAVFVIFQFYNSCVHKKSNVVGNIGEEITVIQYEVSDILGFFVF